MRKAYHSKIRFYVGKVKGRFAKHKWLNEHSILFCKKTAAMARANQIIQSNRQVYIKVTYGQKFFNGGIYQTKKELKSAMAAFTEKQLLDFALAK